MINISKLPAKSGKPLAIYISKARKHLIARLYSYMFKQKKGHFSYQEMPSLPVEKTWLMPAQRAFLIAFLVWLCHAKKHFYPHNCASWRYDRQRVGAVRMFRRKSPNGTFSTVSKGISHIKKCPLYFNSI